MARAHVREPIYMKDPSTGNLKLGVGASVQVCQPGTTTPFVGNVWNASTGGANVGSTLPALGSDGVAQFWLDTQQDVDLLITLSGFTTLQYTTSALDTVDVASPTVADNSVTSTKIVDGAVTSTKLGALAVTTSAIAAGAVTSAKVDSSIVVTAEVGAASGVASLDSSTRIPEPQVYGSGLRRSFRSFGGRLSSDAPAPTLTSQTAAWTAARAWSDGIGGGIVGFGAGLWPHLPKLELGNHMAIDGVGMLATRLQFDASITAGACVYNHVSTNGTTDPNAWGVRVENLTVDCSQLPGWGTNAVNGITLNQNPTFSKATADSSELLAPDTGHVVRNVLVYLAPQDGCVALAMGEQHWEMVKAYQSGRYGFQPPFDSTIFNCTAAFSNKEGFFISGTPCKLVGCKAFSNGNVTHANGQGFHIATSGGLAAVTLVNCEAQDNFAAGFFIDGATGALVSLVGCLADSNSVRGIGSDPAFDVFNSPRAKLVGCSASERNANGVNQIHAVSLRGTSTAVHVEVEHQGTNGSTVSSPFQTIDTTAGASFCSVNNLQGYQSNSSASFSPDLFAGGTVETLGLAAAATVGAPVNGPYPPGTLARFIFKQNATGGFTITWNAAYVNTPTTNTAPNAYTVAIFVYDGTSWVGI